MDGNATARRKQAKTAAEGPAPVADRLGRRELNKLAKRTRILEAAREMFGEQGFSATTIQEIAARAGVAAGTVFLYAKSKEDLLIQAFSGGLEGVVEEARRSLPQSAPVLERLLHIYDAVIDYHASLGPGLSAILLRELMYGPEDRRSNAGMMELERLFDEVIADGQARRELRARLDIAETDDTLFSVFYWQLVHWTLGRMSAEALRARVRERLAVCLTGMARRG